MNKVQPILARAFAAQQAGNIAEAEFLYRLVLQTEKKQFDALHMLGVIEAQRGNFPAGLRHLSQAIRVKPNSVEALTNLARIQSELGEDANAIATYRKAIAINPRFALAHNNLAVLLRRQRRLDEALTHCDKAIEIARDYADAWSNRGNVLFDLNRLPDAVASYDRAVALQPRLAQCHLGRGNIMLQCFRFQESLAAFEKTIALNPNLAEAWFGLGLSLKEHRRYAEALAAFERCAALNPNLPYVHGFRVREKLQICDWQNLVADSASLVAAVHQGARQVTPYTLIALDSSPADQLACTRLYVADRHPSPQRRPNPVAQARHDRIRLAYVSADFHNHATALLAAGMFEMHDRSRFETIAVSYGPDENDDMRSRLRAGFDRFLDVRERDDADIARLMGDLEVDIAVDLKGFTGYSRPAIFQQRVAPIQVNYLGYPGTMGADYIDYIIADTTVIPPEHERFYAEKIAWLPDTYQVNDSRRLVPDAEPTRSELGLPEQGFVFCCFNNSYKVTPPVFDIWMRLLRGVENSVLWLLDDNEAATRNLFHEAERRGVGRERLVLAPRAPLPAHLARQRRADLFLDTLPYNAHTTASDALWMGLPVLTCLGSAFAGRVGASVLRAIGLSELVTESLTEYEALALKIAADPALHGALRTKLARNRETCPLFDTERFTRHIEEAYARMWRRHALGEPPESFSLASA